MKAYKPLSSYTLNRIEKIASDIRMMFPELDVEVVVGPDRAKIIVRESPNGLNGLKVYDIMRLCNRRGLLYNIFSFIHDGKSDLTFEIF